MNNESEGLAGFLVNSSVLFGFQRSSFRQCGPRDRGSLSQPYQLV